MKQAVIIHATGDEIVPYSNATEVAGDLVGLHVPTVLEELIPASGQPAVSTDWHITTASTNDVIAALIHELRPIGRPSQGLVGVLEQASIG